ncbi:uncharacterized protein N7500_002203 [Penicillium coprophilum]|uniref:uncharacterized protein n=1 Tax=Penicillium coprophilum TaxID=36646 RepID=UPI00238E9FE1|nr:uncharacterized protein N7500_002203 [Penicillium coprophilum]KAJ5169420.1 hypothetical protein N7500_002203 [Penicillium coprophilum]
MTVAVGSKTPLILQIPQLAHLIFSFPSTKPIFFPAFLSREFELQLPVPPSSPTSSANKMYSVAGQRG